MKQVKRKKSAAAPDKSLDAELPDAAYVEQLLAASAPASVPAVSAVAESVVAETSLAEPTLAEPTTAAPMSLPAQCGLRDAVEYRQHLLACVQDKSVTVDVAAVERIDTAFMQVLLAFVRSRPRDSEPVVWLNVNSVFVEAACLLGLQAVLAIPEIDAAA